MNKSWDILILMNNGKYSFLDYGTTAIKNIESKKEYETLKTLNEYALKDVDMDKVVFIKRNPTIKELEFFNRIRVIL